jgi:hypothetical protein
MIVNFSNLSLYDMILHTEPGQEVAVLYIPPTVLPFENTLSGVVDATGSLNVPVGQRQFDASREVVYLCLMDQC